MNAARPARGPAEQGVGTPWNRTSQPLRTVVAGTVVHLSGDAELVAAEILERVGSLTASRIAIEIIALVVEVDR